MVISGLTPVVMPLASGRTQHTDFGGFVVSPPAMAPDSRSAGVRTEPAATISGSMMLALQEQVGRDTANQDARRHGNRMLAALGRLQRALLSTDDSSRLEDLAELVRIDIRDAEPALAGVLSSIKLRARIELERRSRRPELRLTNG